MTLTLQQDDLDRLQEVADKFHLDIGEVIQRSIATALFLQDEIDDHSQILIRHRDGSVDEVVLSY